MRRSTFAGICVIAAFGASAISAVAAQAEQYEFGHCKKAAKVGKTYQGKYSDKNCTDEVATGGKYEFEPVHTGSAIAETGKGKAAQLSAFEIGSVVCKGSSSSLEITGPKEGEGSVVFSGCETSGAKCTTAGETAGTLAMKVKVTLDYEPPKTVSIKIEIGKALQFSCGNDGDEIHVVVSGATDGLETGNVDLMSAKSTDSWGGSYALSSEFEGDGIAVPTELQASLAFKGEKLEVKTEA